MRIITPIRPARVLLIGLLFTAGCQPPSNDGGDQNTTGDSDSSNTGGDTNGTTGGDTSGNTGGDMSGNPDGDTSGNTGPVNTPLPAGILGVKADATGKKDGTSWIDAFTDLQDAFAAARVPGSNIQQIWVAKGAYKPAGPGGDPQAQFKLINELTLYGGFAGTENKLSDRNVEANITILSGDLNGDDSPNGANQKDNCEIVVSAKGVIATAILDGFSLTGAKSGAFNSLQATPLIRNCTFADNRSTDTGGAAHVTLGQVIFEKCVFRSNQAVTDGGAVQSGGPVRFTDCLFENNGAARGGAIYTQSGTVSMTRCSFKTNLALQGGAIANTGLFVLSNCNFIGNSSTNPDTATPVAGGGAIYCAPRPSATDTLYAISCIFQQNTAASFGGAIHGDAGAGILALGCLFDRNTGSEGGAIHAVGLVELAESTFSRNSATGTGGGVFIDAAIWDISSTILWGNTADRGLPISRQLYLVKTPASANMLQYSDVQDFPMPFGVNNINTDPLFVDAANANYHLKPASPAIGKGVETSGLTTDLDGNPRVQGMPPLIDMGAYEQ